MSTETIQLLSNITASVSDSAYSYSNKDVGAGYHKKLNNLHTAVYSVNSFVGTIKLQATLALDPSNNDWFDIVNSSFGGDSTITGGTTTHTVNFSGNFVWIRAAYNLQDGTITSVQYNS
jgi:hypothetical protein